MVKMVAILLVIDARLDKIAATKAAKMSPLMPDGIMLINCG